MNDIVPLIRRMTEDLRALQSAIQATKANQPRGVHEDLLEQIISTQLTQEFKSAIDQMRHFLWCYIEDSANTHRNSSTGMERSRLHLVCETLRILSQTAVPVSLPRPETMSFFERVDCMVSERLQVETLTHELENGCALTASKEPADGISQGTGPVQI